MIEAESQYRPASVAADLDGDGDLDIISSRYGGLDWFENTAGSYQQHAITGANAEEWSYLTAIEPVDFDGDGDVDIVAGGRYGNHIFWFENEDSDKTTFHGHLVSDAASEVQSLTTADIDGDADLDVVVALYSDDKFIWYERIDGDTFNEQLIADNRNTPNSVQAVDMDGDGDVDVLASSQERVSWYRNVGGGAFVESIDVPMEADNVLGAFADDLDADGDFDVLVADIDEGVLFVENTSNDGFGWASPRVIDSLETGHAAVVTTADMDADGDRDVLVVFADVGGSDRLLRWYENVDGDASEFIPHRVGFSSGGTPIAVNVADLDGDADFDVLIPSPNFADGVLWFHNTGGQFALTTVDTRVAAFEEQLINVEDLGSNPLGSPFDVVSADFDADGDLDAVVRELAPENGVVLFSNDGTGSFLRETVSALGGTDPGIDMLPADMNRDGVADLVLLTNADDQIRWLENDGSGQFATQHDISNGESHVRVAVGDVDRDGDLDVVSFSFSGAEKTLVWFENRLSEGLAFRRTEFGSIESGFAASVHIADVNGDGYSDVLASFAGAGAPNPRWYENNGLQEFLAHELYPDGGRIDEVGDFDGDGDLDAVLAGDDEPFSWLENDGEGTFTPHPIEVTEDLLGQWEIEAADVDGDGDLDLVSAAGIGVAWYENIGGEFREHVLKTRTPFASNIFVSVSTGDVDNDGDLDIFAADLSSRDLLTDTETSRVSWFENIGNRFVTGPLNPARGIPQGGQTDVLAITAAHLGRAGDAAVELDSFELFFSDEAGAPLSSVAANSLIANLWVYLDDGSGVYEAEADTAVAHLAELGLTDGLQTVLLPDDSSAVTIAAGETKTYFIVPELTADALSQTPNRIRISHVTEASSTGSNADSGAPLVLEAAENTSSLVRAIGDDVFPVSKVHTAGVITDSTPTIRWTAARGPVDHYELLVYNLSGVLVVDEPNVAGPAYTVETELPAFAYFQVFVRPVSVSGKMAAWSHAEYFSIDPDPLPPLTPNLTGPGSAVPDTTPTIAWEEALRADTYNLLGYDVGLGRPVLFEYELTGSSFTVTTPLEIGHTYQVFAQAENAGGRSGFSPPLLFEVVDPVAVAAAKPVLTGPQTAVTDLTPTLTWTEFGGANYYHLHVYSMDRGVAVLIDNTTQTHYTLDESLPPGETYQVFVKAYSSTTTTDFSDPLAFTIDAMAVLPGTTKIRVPVLPTADNTPTLIWDLVLEADRYELLVFDMTTGQKVIDAQTRDRFYVPAAPMPAGRYQAFTRAVSHHGVAGDYSSPFEFEVTALLPKTAGNEDRDAAATPSVPFVPVSQFVTAGDNELSESEQQEFAAGDAESTATADPDGAPSIVAGADLALDSVFADPMSVEQWSDGSPPAAKLDTHSLTVAAGVGAVASLIRRKRRDERHARECPRSPFPRRLSRARSSKLGESTRNGRECGFGRV